MNVIFIDTMDVNANWQKEWDSLSDHCKILKPAELANLVAIPTETVPNEAALIVIHESIPDKSNLVVALRQSTFTHLCWMLVAASSLDGSTSPDAREHKSRIAFPGTPTSLAFLKNRLDNLVSDLLSIPRTGSSDLTMERRKRAWENWERISDEVLPSLAVFCEGFLASQADKFDEWKNTAKTAGLVDDDEINAMTEDLRKEIVQHKDWFADPKEWRSVFGNASELKMIVENELAGCRLKLEHYQSLGTLLTAIGGQSSLTLAVVIPAYRNIREIRRCS